MSRLSAYGSNATGYAVDRLQTPISFSCSARAAMCCDVFTSIACFSVVTCGRCEPRADPHEIRAARQHRLLGHPEHMRRELIDDLRPGVRRREHVAARDVDRIVDRERDGVARAGFREIAVRGHDACDA